jgi:hypothetical protein
MTQIVHNFTSSEYSQSKLIIFLKQIFLEYMDFHNLNTVDGALRMEPEE